MITALIRTHPGRELSTIRAIESAINEGCETIINYGEKTPGFQYNLYCNKMKDQVKEGYFFFLDSDDFVIPGSIKKILPRLIENKANIVQMLRGRKPKPATNKIVRGRIGMPCIVLHHLHKNIADITETVHGDYDWIKAVTDKIGYKWIPIPLVNAGRRNHGR